MHEFDRHLSNTMNINDRVIDGSTVIVLGAAEPHTAPVPETNLTWKGEKGIRRHDESHEYEPPPRTDSVRSVLGLRERICRSPRWAEV